MITTVDSAAYSLSGKIAVVTGASRGFGALLCEELAARDAEVIGISRTETDLKKLQEAITSKGGKFSYISADLTKEEDIKRIVEEIYEMGGCNVMVNNVGEFKLGYVEEMEIGKIRTQAGLDFVAGAELYEMWKRKYKENYENARRPERVLWIGSVSGIFSWPGDPLYQAWKTALSAYVEGEILSLQKQKQQAKYDSRIKEFYGPLLDLDIKHAVLYPATSETDTLRKVVSATLNDDWGNWYTIKKGDIKDTVIAAAIKSLTGEDNYGKYNHIAVLAYPLGRPDGVYAIGMPLNSITGRPDFTIGEKIERLKGMGSFAKLHELIGDTESK